MEIPVNLNALKIGKDDKMTYRIYVDRQNIIRIPRVLMGELLFEGSPYYRVYAVVNYELLNYAGDLGIQWPDMKCKQVFLNKAIIKKIFNRLFSSVTVVKFPHCKDAMVYVFEETKKSSIEEKSKTVRQLFKGFF